MNPAPGPFEIGIDEALLAQARGAVFLDVREAAELNSGICPGAVCIAMSSGLEPMLAWARTQATPVHVVCASGARSLRAAQALTAAGIVARSVTGGMQAWRALGGAVVMPETVGDDRYLRHLLLPEVGRAGQDRFARARVAVVGAGGLGSPAAYYLAAAGVGFIRIIDDDRVERSNLQRQILHRDDRVGVAKVASAAQTLSGLNPTIRIEPVAQRLDRENAAALFGDCDLVVDGADNFPTRQLVNATCLQLGKPWVYGAVHRFEGQVSVFDPRAGRGVVPCYRCLFPEAPRAEDAPNCAEAGVLGVLPGIIGTLQANEALKLLLGIGSPLVGRLLLFDALAMRFRELRYGVDALCPGCGSEAKFDNLPDTRAPICSVR